MSVKTKQSKDSKSGYVLLAVISILTMTSMVAAIVVSNTRLEARIARAELDGAKVRAGIHTAIARAVFLLGAEDGLVADGRVFSFDLEDMSYKARLVDERGLIGLNSANSELLEKLIEQFAPKHANVKSLADAILDWRDADSDPRPSGAEARTYANMSLPPPGNRAFVHIAELRRVAGMTDDIFASISPLLSISSTQAKPDPQFAPLAILELLELSSSEINRILDARQTDTSLPSELQTNERPSPDLPKSDEDNLQSQQIFHGFVEVETQNGIRRAEHLRVRINSQTGRLDLYARQVIDYGSADQWFEERDDP